MKVITKTMNTTDFTIFTGYEPVFLKLSNFIYILIYSQKTNLHYLHNLRGNKQLFVVAQEFVFITS
jgi:hypothetical protein